MSETPSVAALSAIRPPEPLRSTWGIALLVLVAAELSILAAAGWFAGALAQDTESYRFLLTWPEAFASMRHPLYGLLLRGFDPIEKHLGAIAIAQAAFHIVAVLVLFREARRFGLGGAASFALAVSALLSQSFLLYGRQALPEAPAISAMVLVFAAMLRVAGSARPSIPALCAAGLFAGIACFLRPVYLVAIPVLPVATTMLARLHGRAALVHRGLLMALALAVPFLLQSSIRAATVGDFNIVSFGGFQMAAAAGLMIEPQHIEKYPEAIRPTAARALKARTEAEHAGEVYATPLNSSDVRWFMSAALGYFDIYARTLDRYLWKGISGLRQPGESWVDFNRRMQSFAIATMTIVPERWLAWIVGGTSRFVGRAFITNAPFLLFALAALAIGVFRLFAGGSTSGAVPGRDWLVVAILTAAWALSAIVAPIVVAFPSTRYIETAALFVPSIALLAAIALGKSGHSDHATG